MFEKRKLSLLFSILFLTGSWCEYVCGPKNGNRPCPDHLPCCSQWGFCGNSEPYCDVAVYKCQYNCWTNSTVPSAHDEIKQLLMKKKLTNPNITKKDVKKAVEVFLAGVENAVPAAGESLVDAYLNQSGMTKALEKKAEESSDSKDSVIPAAILAEEKSEDATDEIMYEKMTAGDLGIRSPLGTYGAEAGAFNSPLKESFMRGENPYFDARGLYSSCAVKGSVALTYDDGPSEHTGALLDALKSFGYHATFFVLGKNIKTSEDRALVKRMHEEGHIVASHSWSHANLTQLDAWQIKREMDLTAKTIHDIIGKKPALMRPPYGEFNERVKRALFKLGYSVVLWNMDTNDWQHYETDPSKIAKTFEKQLKTFAPVKHAKSWIPLQHDIFQGTVEQQKRIFKMIKKLGYKVVPMSECLGGIPMYQAEKKE